MTAVHRLTITEYEDNATAIFGGAEHLGVAPAEIVRLLNNSNERLRRQFALRSGPLVIRDETVRAEDVAGLLRLSPALELEIAPKFLGDTWERWRSDFFIVATLTRRGFVLPAERLRAGTADRDDLATLVARAMVTEYERLQRTPLRTYTRTTWLDFALDGEAEPEELIRPSAEGYEQTALRLTRQNQYGQTIHAAALALVPEVTDASIRGQLIRVAASLAPQSRPGRRPLPRRVPSRHQTWQGLYDLSRQVLAGFGVNLDADSATLSPGYVVRTPKAWEDFLLAACRLGLPGTTVGAQREHVLGTRNGVAFTVRPDLTIGFSPPLLADAKYKGRAGDGPTSASAADVYEALAFLGAAGCTTLALLYPRPARINDGTPSLGATTVTETVTVDGRTVHAVEVELRGVSGRGGLKIVADQLGAALRSLTPAGTPAAV